MDEDKIDCYEMQLLAIFQSCLTLGKNELEDNRLPSVCEKLNIGEWAEELRLCISLYRSRRKTVTFQEFRNGLLLLFEKDEDTINDIEHSAEPRSDSNTPNVDAERNENLLDAINKAAGTINSEVTLRLWGRIRERMKKGASSSIEFLSEVLNIPELPRHIAQSLFEKLDENSDGLINAGEFVVIFQRDRDSWDAWYKNFQSLQLQESHESHNSMVNRSGALDDGEDTQRKAAYSAPCKLLLAKKTTAVSEDGIAGVSNAALFPRGDLDALDSGLAEITDIICDELKSLNVTLNSDVIQSHVVMLRDMCSRYQYEQRSLATLIENMKAERERMRGCMLEANERANLLAQEIDEHQSEINKIKENFHRQCEHRSAEITKELNDQMNVEREMDARAMRTKDEQLQALQRENHDVKCKYVNALQENQVMEQENGVLHGQIEKLKLCNNDLQQQIKMLDAEHDEIQGMEAKQQEQINFFVDRIKRLQSDLTLARDQSDELNAELEHLKCQNRESRHSAPSSLAQDLQLCREQKENSSNVVSGEDRPAIIASSFESDSETRDGTNAAHSRKLQDAIIKNLENALSTNADCAESECAMKDSVSRIIESLQSGQILQYSALDLATSIASELEMECEERANESLRDLVVSKVQKPGKSRATTASNGSENFVNAIDEDTKNASPSKATSLRNYPPRKEEHIGEHGKASKEREQSSSDAFDADSIEKLAELKEIEAKYTAEKKQLTDRCSQLEQSLDLLRTEYEECEDYWTAKLEEERLLFEQEQKLTDDKFTELISKMREYEELISPMPHRNGRLSPIEEKFNIEQQYVDLEEEFDKWKIKMENDVSLKNLEIDSLRERLRLSERPATSDVRVQVPDNAVPIPSNSSHAEDESNAPAVGGLYLNIVNICDADGDAYRIPEFPLYDGTAMPQGDCVRESLHKRSKGTRGNKKLLSNSKESHGDDRSTREKDNYSPEFRMVQDLLKKHTRGINCQCAQLSGQQRVCCMDINVLQTLNMKLFAQERKKRQLHRYLKRQQQRIEKVLQRIMKQHHKELFDLRYLLRDTQEKLQAQVQTTVDQADKLASADILAKDLYIENACLTAHMKRLQEQYLVLTGLNVETTSM